MMASYSPIFCAQNKTIILCLYSIVLTISSLYFVELHCNIVPIKEASIVSPVNGNRLWNCLDGYHNRAFIADGFRRGFFIGMPHNNNVPVNNYSNANPKPAKNRQVMIDKLNVELKAGRILGPYCKSPIPFATFSPLYVIPKSTPGKFRLIHDLSKPASCSVNSNIPESLKSVQYSTVIEVAEFLATTSEEDGSMWYMAKVDLQDAYRNVPINKEDWRYLGMIFEDKLLIDTCLPMGLSTSCRIFDSISKSLAWVHTKRNPQSKIFSYLDDFLILARTESDCKRALDSFLDLLKFLGFPISTQKTVEPSTSVEFLGLGLNSENLSFYVPESKRIKISDDITSFLAKSSHRVHRIQKLVGKLTFLCTTFLPGKALLAGLYRNLAGILSSNGWAQRRINTAVRNDLSTWLSFLSQTAGKPFKFIFPQISDFEDVMYTDASGSVGFGGVLGKEWFQADWSDDWWHQKNIALLELVPVYIGVVLCHEKLSNKTLAVFTDNNALVAMIQTFYSRDKGINNLLKALALFTMKKNIVIKTQHVKGKHNIVADKLSRGVPGKQILSDEYRQLLIPRGFLQQLKIIIMD